MRPVFHSGLAPRYGCAMRYRPGGRCPHPCGAGSLRRFPASGLAILNWTLSRGSRDRGEAHGRPEVPEAFHRRVQAADSRAHKRREAKARRGARVRPVQEHGRQVGQVDKRVGLAARGRQPHARAEPDHRAGAREQAAAHGGRRFKAPTDARSSNATPAGPTRPSCPTWWAGASAGVRRAPACAAT